MKNDFLLYEFWVLSIQGGFQRSNAYKNDTSDKERIAFRKSLKQFVDTELIPQYQVEVSEKQHENNIIRLCNYSNENFEHLFVKGSLNIGVSQKLLNLYLKYQWCAGWIVTPPHFPVDRIIQQKLNVKPLKPWTKFEDINEYRNVIDFTKKEFSKMNYNSLAEMELNLFERR